MRSIGFKMATLMTALMSTMTVYAKSQDVGGRVINENGQPLPFVNVVLLSLPDSAFVQGAVTDENGMFNIVAKQSEGLLKLTSIGYETLFLPYKAANGLTIQMKEEAQMVGEVIVKGQLPQTHAKGDAMRTTVAGTILEKAGTLSDALAKIPSLEAERDGAVKVIGRGDAEVYINGRRVQDIKELSRLRSDQIQHVDVVQNPGARYKAAVKAVVRITLKKAQGEGFSFQDSAEGMYQYGLSATNNLDVNYRTGGLDITASFWAGSYGHSKSFQDNTLTYYVGKDKIEGVSSQESKNTWKGWSPQLQVNYMVNENHSFGAYYSITKPRIVGNLGIQKDISLRRLGTLTADLRCIDLFNTNKTEAIIYGYRDLATNDPASRTFILDLTWKFNEARSKYRGSGAGDKQKARM